MFFVRPKSRHIVSPTEAERNHKITLTAILKWIFITYILTGTSMDWKPYHEHKMNISIYVVSYIATVALSLATYRYAIIAINYIELGIYGKIFSQY